MQIMEYVYKDSEIPLLITEAEKQKCIALDTENSGGLDVLADTFRLLLLQLNIGGVAYVIDARKVDLSLLKDIISNPRWTKIVQNANYDYKSLRVHRGLYLRGIYDTMIAESVLRAGLVRGGTSLEDLSVKYLESKMDKSTVITFADHPYDEPFTEEQLNYSANDVLILPEIKRQQQMYINQYRLNATAELEFKLVESVAEMELAGFKLDTDLWKRSLNHTKKLLFQISNELRQVLPDPPAPDIKPVRLKKDGTPFANSSKPKPPPILNIDSWQQLVWSFEQIGVNLNEVNKKTKKGPTNNATLKFAQSIYASDPTKVSVLKNLIKYRGLNQVNKTFGENLIDQVGKDGRIHARFWQNGTESGRFSSTDPNLQNIQKKGEEGRILRSCFIPDVDYKFIIADYSQVELRIVAELSEDPLMLSILSDPKGDIHRATASQMYKVPYDKVSGSLRRAAKTLNFGIIYGMQVKTLSERLECSMDEARNALTLYQNTYKRLMEWLEAEGSAAYERGYSRTIGNHGTTDGRIRWFPTLNRQEYETQREFDNMVEYYRRVGKNHPVQGTSANMTKLAMVNLQPILYKLNSKIVNTVHDELCTEAPISHTVDAARAVKSEMIKAGEKFLHKVPVLVEVKIRDCWYKDDFDSAKLGIQDDEEGQQLWLIPPTFDFGEEDEDVDIEVMV